MEHRLGLKHIGHSVRTTEHGPAIYEWYSVTDHLGADVEIDDPIATMRDLLQAEGHVVNGIVGDAKTIREALQGQPSSALEARIGKVVTPRIWKLGHEILPFESLWTWEDYDE